MQRLPNFTQICTAEIYAIDKAVTQCLLEGFDKVIIFVDSKSAIQKVASTGMNISSDYITLKTRRDIVDATDKGIDIWLVWVPSHCGIEGNEVADQLANSGRELCLPDNCGINFVDIFPIIKRRIWKSWDFMWRESIKNKGKEYGEICDSPPRHPWFSKFNNIVKRDVTTIIRMRSGHCLVPTHLYKIGVSENSSCECGQMGDLNHVLFECPINGIDGSDLYEKLSRAGVPSPMNSRTLLANPNNKTVKLIINFLNFNNIKL